MNISRAAERYVAGRMDEREERQFERLMLERPELAAEVAARRQIRAALQQLEERGELAALVGRRAPRSYIRHAIAACLLAMLAAAVVYWVTR